jgi:hypothetical protein
VRRQVAAVLLGVLLSACSAARSPTPVPSPAATPTQTLEPTMTAIPPINSIGTIIGDMQLPHEARPHGVPTSYDWAAGPRIGMGNDPGDLAAIIPWGQVYECAEGNPATNTRVHLRNIALYLLSKSTGEWKEMHHFPVVSGAAFVEDYKYNASRAADERVEPEGGISVTAGDGHNYHFWAWRETIDPDDIAGVFSTIQARLVLADPSGPDDRAQACYLVSMGADYWKDLKVGWAQFKTNGDVAIGRFKRVTVEWQAFNMTTLSADELRANPPPLE